MADTLNSWKQLLKAQQNIGVLDGVNVLPQGGTSISLDEAIVVANCNVTVKNSDVVVINKEVCCPPIEFVNIMGEQDIGRPDTFREDWGRIIFTSKSLVASRISWGPAGSPTAALVNGNGVHGYNHEFFISGLAIGAEYEFIVGGTRSFCSDSASSEIYSFLTGVVTAVAINATFYIAVLTEVLQITSTIVSSLAEPTHYFAAAAQNGEAGVPRAIGMASPTPTVLSISASTVSTLSQTGSDMLLVAAITTVP